jgi:uncharacterized protein YqgC (DUF456 family)
MEQFLGAAGTVGLWAGAVFFTALLAAGCFAVLLALPGGWVALGLAVLYDALHGFHAIGWGNLIVFAVLLGVGEGVEALLGSVYVAKRGATRWGVIGCFLGGVLGAALGTPVVPVAGTLVGGFVGAFAGAVGGEWLRDRQLEPSLQVGLHATVGRFVAVSVKGMLATAGAAVVAVAAFRHLAGGAP